MRYTLLKTAILLFIINFFNANYVLAKSKNCPNRHLTNEWVGSDNQCQKKPLKNLTNSKKSQLEQELQTKKDKRKRVLDALEIIRKENSESGFIVKCAELNRVYSSIRKRECKLGLSASSLE